ncbi:MAG: hypothetical protein EBX52_12885 [Proteobacteria bacterium]|nr:hypothetical protein [Pseudomonadota bacterium]
MKLKFERFEGVASFTIRGRIELSQFRILAIGLEALVKTIEEPLVVNLTLTEIDAPYVKTMIELKKILAKNSKHKLYWVGKFKGLTDFNDLGLLFSRLGGFKLRQIGERLTIEDEVFKLKAKTEALKAEIEKLGGDGDQAMKIVLENRILKEQNKGLKRVIKFTEARMKGQTRSSPSDPEYEQKVKQALDDLKVAYGAEVKL